MDDQQWAEINAMADATRTAHQADQAEGKTVMEKVTALETTANRLDSAEALTTVQLRHFMAEHMRTTAEVMRFLNKRAAHPYEDPADA